MYNLTRINYLLIYICHTFKIYHFAGICPKNSLNDFYHPYKGLLLKSYNEIPENERIKKYTDGSKMKTATILVKAFFFIFRNLLIKRSINIHGFKSLQNNTCHL